MFRWGVEILFHSHIGLLDICDILGTTANVAPVIMQLGILSNILWILFRFDIRRVSTFYPPSDRPTNSCGPLVIFILKNSGSECQCYFVLAYMTPASHLIFTFTSSYEIKFLAILFFTLTKIIPVFLKMLYKSITWSIFNCIFDKEAFHIFCYKRDH